MVETLPSPPFIEVKGLPNFRDIGGYPIALEPGKQVRRGVVFRAAEPSKVEDDGVETMRGLGIKHVYDLRSLQEFERLADKGYVRPVKEWEGATRVFSPVFRNEDYSPEAIAVRFKHYADGPGGFAGAYMAILEAAASPSNEAQPYATILSHLSRSTGAPTPILVHCTAGKDRTGVICGLILSLCGVEDEVVAHEYGLTDLGLKPRHKEIIEHLVKEPAFRDDPKGAESMVRAKRENMMTTLRKIRETWGSVEKCVTELNMISPEGIETLKKNLVVETTTEAPVDWQQHGQRL